MTIFWVGKIIKIGFCIKEVSQLTLKNSIIKSKYIERQTDKEREKPNPVVTLAVNFSIWKKDHN